MPHEWPIRAKLLIYLMMVSDILPRYVVTWRAPGAIEGRLSLVRGESLPDLARRGGAGADPDGRGTIESMAHPSDGPPKKIEKFVRVCI